MKKQIIEALLVVLVAGAISIALSYAIMGLIYFILR
jgi:hypothetical protein